ncbi:killer cell lectin-like receptor subfamily B member 1B allele C [Pelecanus crispus]|uniref:killer cell lectin-like receptor subfamily B member 1B allele C n=1 Tax=Pelecanus crispus TaxID=36300 RepID=UPI003F5D4835
MADGPLASAAVAGEIIYADLDIGPGKRCRRLHSLPQPGTSGCPQWHRTALWAGWTGNLLLGVAVVGMGCSFLHQQSQNPGSCKNGSGNVGDGNATLENIRSELKKGLCLSKLQESEGCRLCPTGWVLRGTKCYWAADRFNPWNKSREDCANRGAELMMPGDLDDLDFLNKILQKPSRYFWIDLSLPSSGKGWTWVNGSRLDQSRFPLSPGDEGRACGMLRQDKIGSNSCSSGLHWICQKEATQL